MSVPREHDERTGAIELSVRDIDPQEYFSVGLLLGMGGAQEAAVRTRCMLDVTTERYPLPEPPRNGRIRGLHVDAPAALGRPTRALSGYVE